MANNTDDYGIKFTDAERLIVAMLTDLAKPVNEREIDFDFVNASVFNGHTWALKWEYTGIFPSVDDTEVDVKHVSDTLYTWEFVERAFAGFNSAQKAEYFAAVDSQHPPEFTGFDGNNETGLMGIAQHLVERMKRYQHFKGRGLNSHMPTSQRYRQMNHEFARILPELSSGRNLTPLEVAGIISAGRA